MSINYIAEVIDRLVNTNRVLPEQLAGFSEEEVIWLEKQLKYPLPIAFRQFLLTMGRETEEFRFGTDMLVPDLRVYLELRKNAEYLLKHYDMLDYLPDDAFIFETAEGCDYCYFLTAERLENPPVYGFTEVHLKPQFITSTFIEFLLKAI